MGALASIAKGFLTLTRLADLGLTTYNLVEDIWLEVDWESRYPDIKKLLDRVVEAGAKQDESLKEVLKLSIDIANFNSGITTLRDSVSRVNNLQEVLYKRYAVLDEMSKNLSNKIPALQQWHDENWVKNEILKRNEIVKALDKFDLGGLNKVFIGTFLAARGAYLLYRAGYYSFALHKYIKGPSPPQRKDAMVPATSFLGKQKEKLSFFKLRHRRLGKVMKGIGASTSLLSFGLNIYVFVARLNNVADQKDRLHKDLAAINKCRKNIGKLLNGIDGDEEFKEIKKYFELDIEDNDEAGRKELKIGMKKTFGKYEGEIKEMLSFVGKVYSSLYDNMKEVAIWNEDKTKISVLREEYKKFQTLEKLILNGKNTNIRKQNIDTVNENFVKEIIPRITLWIEALDKAIVTEKSRVIVFKRGSVLKDSILKKNIKFGSDKYNFMLEMTAGTIFESLEELAPDRGAFLTKEELIEALEYIMHLEAKDRVAVSSI